MEYLIGAGAILEGGEQARLTPAALHARVDSSLAGYARAVAIDFEGQSAGALRRLVVVLAGRNSREFRHSVSNRLLARGDCSLADVLTVLARAGQTSELHIFAHWLPDEPTCAALREAGIEVIAHPLEAIETAALVAGQRHTRWRPVAA